MKRFFKMLPIMLVLVAFGVAIGASKVTSSSFRLEGKPLIVTSQITSGSTASELGIDSDKNPSKHAIVHRWSIGGQEVDVLVRVQTARGSIFVDLVASPTIAALVTTVNALNLTGIGHPSPTKDVVDGQAMTDAGGS